MLRRVDNTNSTVQAVPFYTFPIGWQPENIRPRASGQLLVTINTGAPALYQVDPSRSQHGRILHQFGGYQSLFGIVEPVPNVFYIIASNFSDAPDYYGFQGSTSIFQVNLSGVANPASRPGPKVTKVLDIPEAQLLDGLAVANADAGLLISGDAQTGTLYLIDVQRRTAKAVLQDELLKGTSDERAAALAHVGINGVKISGDTVYFTNTAKGTHGKVPIDRTTALPKGKPSVIADYTTYTDDLSFDRVGNQFISEPLFGVLLRPAKNGDRETRLLTSLFGANANAFGRCTEDRCILYSTFNGNPSGLARVDTRKFGFCSAD
ncbi:MAG: hypothetical protein Q9190_002544 [Brigantiaea leucoxantha]